MLPIVTSPLLCGLLWSDIVESFQALIMGVHGGAFRLENTMPRSLFIPLHAFLQAHNYVAGIDCMVLIANPILDGAFTIIPRLERSADGFHSVRGPF